MMLALAAMDMIVSAGTAIPDSSERTSVLLRLDVETVCIGLAVQVSLSVLHALSPGVVRGGLNERSVVTASIQTDIVEY